MLVNPGTRALRQELLAVVHMVIVIQLFSYAFDYFVNTLTSAVVSSCAAVCSGKPGQLTA